MQSLVPAAACAVARLAALAGLTLPVAAAAQSGGDAGDLMLPESVVVASRVTTPGEQTGGALSVIDGAQLEARQIRAVSDALRDLPGVSVSRSGGPGALTDVRIRGAENNHTLVLIDGVEANDPAISAYDFAHLLNVAVERIEVLRGPQSALWGSDALGGVVNIVTRRGDGPARVTASLEGGSFRTVEGTLGVAGGTDATHYSLGAGFLDSDGFSIAPDGDEDDGYRNLTLSANAGHAFGEAFELGLTARYSDGRTESDPQDFAFPPAATYGLVVDGDDHSEVAQFTGRLQGTLNLWDDRWEQRFGASLTDTDSEFFSDDARTSRLRGEKRKFDYQSAWYLGDDGLAHTLVLALEHEKESFSQRGDTPDAASNQDRDLTTRSVVGEYRLAIDRRWFLTAAARHDDNERFGDADTYRLTGAWVLSEPGTRLHASYGTGVKNPTFTELFGFFPGSFVGNPGLEPERARSWDVGVEQSFLGGRWVADLTWFQGRFVDEIVTTFDSETFLSSVQNSDGVSRRRGLELTLSARLDDRLTLRGAYSYVDAEDADGEDEIRRPRHGASLGLDYLSADRRTRIGVDVSYTGERDDLFFGATPASREVLGDYTLVGLRGSYRLGDSLTLFGRVENLLDEDYQDIYGYDTAGVAAYAGVRAEF